MNSGPSRPDGNTIGADHTSYRVVDDKGEPILFPREGFRVVDDAIPQDWIWDRQGEDEYYCGPPSLQTPGFYEDYLMVNAKRSSSSRSICTRTASSRKSALATDFWQGNQHQLPNQPRGLRAGGNCRPWCRARAGIPRQRSTRVASNHRSSGSVATPAQVSDSPRAVMGPDKTLVGAPYRSLKSLLRSTFLHAL
jgi:hypothetical protein